VRKLLGNDVEDEENMLNGNFQMIIEKYLAQLKESDDKKEQRKLKYWVSTLYEKALLHGLANYVRGSTMIVNRLAPIDYHNFHFPFSSGRILGRAELADKLQLELKSMETVPSKMKEIYSEAIHYLKKSDSVEDPTDPAIHLDGQYLSVSTMATTSKALKYNPLVENVRDILFIETPEYGIVPFVVIGATGVGANIIKVKSGQQMKMGDEMGLFEFGGSTVIMFVPENRAEAYPKTKKIQNIFYKTPHSSDESASESTEREMEVYTQVGTPLFHPMTSSTARASR
jgi:phosphatidylserine decarboxylase